jgi:hypothetical protein
MVYADSIITIHKEVDDKAIETIALKDVTAIHGNSERCAHVIQTTRDHCVFLTKHIDFLCSHCCIGVAYLR